MPNSKSTCPTKTKAFLSFSFDVRMIIKQILQAKRAKSPKYSLDAFVTAIMQSHSQKYSIRIYTSQGLLMMQSLFENLIVLHAGTSPVVSQTSLTIMFVALGIALVGIGFGYLVKNRENLLLHRWTLTIAAVLVISVIALVMLPTFIRYYSDPDVESLSPISITTLIHTAVGAPAIVTAVYYAFGRLPKNPKKWMRLTALLWIATMVMGVLMFLQMMDLFPAMA